MRCWRRCPLSECTLIVTHPVWVRRSCRIRFSCLLWNLARPWVLRMSRRILRRFFRRTRPCFVWFWTKFDWLFCCRCWRRMPVWKGLAPASFWGPPIDPASAWLVAVAACPLLPPRRRKTASHRHAPSWVTLLIYFITHSTLLLLLWVMREELLAIPSWHFLPSFGFVISNAEIEV